MKYLKTFSAVVAILGMTTVASAGLFGDCAAAKSCDGAPECAPVCRPVVKIPCCPKVYTYQRQASTITPPCCDSSGCDTAAGCKKCCKNKCSKSNCCAPAPNACAPACAPGPNACAAPAACAPAASAPGCAAPAATCDSGACDAGPDCCPGDPCVIAELIYQSQTACYAKDRCAAIHKLGNCFDCRCNPEIMVAFMYSLNDCDERVRRKAADEIGDQLRKNPCCCSSEITAALTCALADCDKKVVKEAKQALELCGYCVEKEDCCTEVACDTCDKAACDGCAPAAGGASGMAPAPAPAPAKDPNAYFPSRLRIQQTSFKNSLSNLFGLGK